MGRIVADASSAIKAKLQSRGGKFYSIVNYPSIALVEIAAGNFSQLGGRVWIQRNAAGTVRIVGAAGKALDNFQPLKFMELNYTARTVGLPKVHYTGTQRLPALETVEWSLTDLRFVDAWPAAYTTGFSTEYGVTTGSDVTPTYAFAAADIVETLEMGWVCVCESGLIWEGQYTVLASGLASTLMINHTSMTVATSTRIALKLLKSSMPWAAAYAEYIADCDDDVKDYVTQAWNEQLALVPAEVRVVQPFQVMLSERGLEIGAPCRQHVFPRAGTHASVRQVGLAKYLPFYASDTTAATPEPAFSGVITPAMGQNVNGVVIPRLIQKRETSPTLVRPWIDPYDMAPVSQWPETFGPNKASQIMGPMFPAVYAKDGWVGNIKIDVAIDALVQPRSAQAPLLGDDIEEQAANPLTGFKGDALRKDMGLASKHWTTPDSWGGGVNAYFAAFLKAVDTRAEQLLRAQKSHLS